MLGNLYETREQQLFRSIQQMRLEFDLDRINAELEAHKPVGKGANIFESAVNSVGDFFKEIKTEELEIKKAEIEGELERFRETGGVYSSEWFDEERMTARINAIFNGESSSASLDYFGIVIVLDGEYKYKYRTEGLARISEMLYGDKAILPKMEKRLEQIYAKIAKRSLTKDETYLVISSIAIAGLVGLIGAGALGLGVAGVASVGLAVIAGTVTYTLLDEVAKDETLREFREMSLADSARLLTVRAYMAELAMEKNSSKEEISDLVAMIDDLRADTNYRLLVERENIEDNKRRIAMFHNLDNLLAGSLA